VGIAARKRLVALNIKRYIVKMCFYSAERIKSDTSEQVEYTKAIEECN